MENLYLSSLESVIFEETRECVFIKTLHFTTGKECMLVRLLPAVNGQHYGFGSDIEQFILSARHKGEMISAIVEFPCFVYIAVPRVPNIGEHETIDKKDVQVIAWGELYKSRDKADKHMF